MAPKKSKKNKKDLQWDSDDDALLVLEKLDQEENEKQEATKKQIKEVQPVQVETGIQYEVEEEVDKKPKKEKEKEVVEGEQRIKSKKEKEKERKERAKLAAKGKKVAKAVFEEEEETSTSTTVKPTKGKVSSAIQALRDAVEKRRLEEEAELKRIQDEEERLKREEEEKQLLIEQEIKRKEEKKERERLKKEELKKQGLYQTPAQKKEAQKQKLKLEALLASGVIVQALQDEKQHAEKKKKVIYGNKKKKTSIKVETPEKVEKLETVKDAWDQSDSETKDTWDASEDDVKDAWDISDEESEPVKTNTKADKPVEPEADDWDVSDEEEVIISSTAISHGLSGPKKSAQKSQKRAEVAHTKSASKKVVAEDKGFDAELEVSSKIEKVTPKRKEDVRSRKEENPKEFNENRNKEDLRSPICVILGHVDTGKTKLLDKIRQTNVQEGEAGGITQQIGATFFPIEAIEEKTKMIHKEKQSGYKLPGLLIIDTPGHESFTNLRSRGSSLCNIAVLVVDIVHGLEPQTIESINLLKARKTPFVVALNKIDRLFDWKTHENYPTRDTLALQKKSVIQEFESRVSQTIVAFAEQGLNACLYWENKNMGKYVSLIPTSAITGEGVPDLLHLLIDLTQSRMTDSLRYLSELECTVLEVKVIEGLGTTIDVVLSNGVLNEGDKICVCGLNGAIVTTIRALLTPENMKELRVKGQYVHHKSVKASLGIKISAPDLEKAIPGAKLLRIGPDDDEEEVMEAVMTDLTTMLTSVDKSGKGVCVQASTLGSLEALLTFLKQMEIPVSGISIGPVHKKDIIKTSVMLERAPMYAILLAFDVIIERDAELLAQEMGVQIFKADIIYHLFDQFKAYMAKIDEQKKKDAIPKVVFPCVLKMVRDAVFNKRSPLIIGVDVEEGVLKIGTPLCVVQNGVPFSLGKVVGIEMNHKSKQEVKKGDPSVAIRVECASYQTTAMYGRHFTHDDEIYSHITRDSINVLKENFRSEMDKEGWALVIKLKKILKIA